MNPVDILRFILHYFYLMPLDIDPDATTRLQNRVRQRGEREAHELFLQGVKAREAEEAQKRIDSAAMHFAAMALKDVMRELIATTQQHGVLTAEPLRQQFVAGYLDLQAMVRRIHPYAAENARLSCADCSERPKRHYARFFTEQIDVLSASGWAFQIRSPILVPPLAVEQLSRLWIAEIAG